MMAKKKTSSRGLKTKQTRAPVDDEISFMDIETNRSHHIKKGDFEQELKRIHDHLQSILNNIGTIGKYSLKEIEFSVGVSAGFIVVTVQGGITLRYAMP
jgi:uncharacterized FlaG/YvyC family protein